MNLDVVLDTVRQLVDAGFEAAPTAVLVLHPVVKATASPTPSALNVQASDHRPEGRIVVAVIDTGIAEQRRGDGWLNEVLRLADNVDPLDVFGGNPSGPNGFLDFAAAHGTFAAGIVRQVDPEAEIRSYLALDSDGFGSEISVACAMIRAVREGADVVNLSLGMRTVDDQPCLALETALDIIDEISESLEPAVLVASAGNYGDDRPVWPAASRRVISVAALAQDPDDRSQFITAQWSSSRRVGGLLDNWDREFSPHTLKAQEDPAFEDNDILPAKTRGPFGRVRHSRRRRSRAQSREYAASKTFDRAPRYADSSGPELPSRISVGDCKSCPAPDIPREICLRG